MSVEHGGQHDRIERAKAVLDYLKHLTTLSTGSILLLAAFVEKVFPTAVWKPLTAVAILGFMLSILASIAAHTLFLADFPGRKRKETEWEKVLVGISLTFAWGGFLVGILLMAIFTFRNLIQ